MITLIKYAISMLVWLGLAALLLVTGKIIYLMFWVLIGALLIIIWLGHMAINFMRMFDPDFKPIKVVLSLVVIVVLAVAGFRFIIAPWWNNWGSTPEEIASEYEADRYCPQADLRAVRTVEINAPPDFIYRWVRQIPELGAGGWKLLDLGRKKEFEKLLDDLPELKKGDRFLIGKVEEVKSGKSITFDIGADESFPKLGIKCIYGGYYFKKIKGNKTRINTVIRADYDGIWGWLYSQIIIEIGDFFVTTRQLARIKEAAERHSDDRD